jgi:hypothetical protein
MFWLGNQIVQWVGITLFVIILVLLGRRQLYRQFPVFTLYVAYMTVITLLRTSTNSRPHLYYYAYWAAEPGALLLKLLAVCESFMKVFRGFYVLQKFRLLLPGAIAVGLVVSVLRAISHPSETATANSIINAGAMAAQYIVLAVSVLFVGLVILLHVPWRVHEYRIVLGFGISSLGTFSEAALHSQFPTGFGILSTTLATGAYTLALVVWITAVHYPQTPKLQVIDRGVSREDLVRELRRQVAYTRSMLGQ